MKTKKGQITLMGLIVGMVTIGIILGVGLLVLGEIKDQTTEGSAEYSGINSTAVAVGTITNWLPMIITLSIVGVLLGLVFYLVPRQEEGGGTGNI